MTISASLLLVFSLLTSHAYGAELWLRVGETRDLAADRAAAVRVSARGLIRVVDTERGVRVIALKPGQATMVVGTIAYQVRVTLASQKEFAQELERVLQGLMGLSLNRDGAALEVRGTLLRFSDWQRLAEVARRYQGEYIFRARALPDVGKQAMAHFTEVAHAHGFPVLRFRAEPEFIAQLPNASQSLKAAAERSLQPYGIRVETTNSDLALQPLVRTQVVLAEVSRAFSRQLGIKWPSEYQAAILPPLAPSESPLMATLQALEARGEGQILASPNLICRSGGEAHFLAGGEFPIRMASRNRQEVVWKQHGVVLHVKPRADFQGAMSLELETEISLLDAANAVDGVPALKKNTVSSHFDLAGKRTIALSGLLRNESGTSREGVPFLSAIPVLGRLFSSQNYQARKSELVVFVTPEIYTPESSEPPTMPEGFVRDEP